MRNKSSCVFFNHQCCKRRVFFFSQSRFPPFLRFTIALLDRRVNSNDWNRFVKWNYNIRPATVYLRWPTISIYYLRDSVLANQQLIGRCNLSSAVFRNSISPFVIAFAFLRNCAIIQLLVGIKSTRRHSTCTQGVSFRQRLASE